MKTCDRKVVGVIVTDPIGDYLLLNRAKPPAGRAPVAGHVDEHTAPREAAVAEAREEAGLTLLGRDLRLVADGFVGNRCRRPVAPHNAPDGHHWWIYATRVSSNVALSFSADETRGGAWHTRDELQMLAERTALWCTGQLGDEDYLANPGLEPVWVAWMARYLDMVKLAGPALNAIEAQFSQAEQI